jgi:hypothetical protein
LGGHLLLALLLWSCGGESDEWRTFSKAVDCGMVASGIERLARQSEGTLKWSGPGNRQATVSFRNRIVVVMLRKSGEVLEVMSARRVATGVWPGRGSHLEELQLIRFCPPPDWSK